jgi:hypothetical protein
MAGFLTLPPAASAGGTGVAPVGVRVTRCGWPACGGEPAFRRARHSAASFGPAAGARLTRPPRRRQPSPGTARVSGEGSRHDGEAARCGRWRGLSSLGGPGGGAVRPRGRRRPRPASGTWSGSSSGSSGRSTRRASGWRRRGTSRKRPARGHRQPGRGRRRPAGRWPRRGSWSRAAQRSSWPSPARPTGPSTSPPTAATRRPTSSATTARTRGRASRRPARRLAARRGAPWWSSGSAPTTPSTRARRTRTPGRTSASGSPRSTPGTTTAAGSRSAGAKRRPTEPRRLHDARLRRPPARRVRRGRPARRRRARARLRPRGWTGVEIGPSTTLAGAIQAQRRRGGLPAGRPLVAAPRRHGATGLGLTLSAGGDRADGDDPCDLHGKLSRDHAFVDRGGTGLGVDPTRGENLPGPGRRVRRRAPAPAPAPAGATSRCRAPASSCRGSGRGRTRTASRSGSSGSRPGGAGRRRRRRRPRGRSRPGR